MDRMGCAWPATYILTAVFETPATLNTGSEAKDPTSSAFKDELRATLSDYKKKLREELSAPSNVAHVPPPWTNDSSKHWTMEEKMAWWGDQPQATSVTKEPSVATEFQEWLKNVYRKHIPECEFY
ncbi:hypothetical protein C0991_001414 [Blastosporella zonata]|nr:hypothetical protein C0991_001414 [Blastosporella zonata]